MTQHTTGAGGGGIEFLKGHGTLNDFVIVPDPGAQLRLDAPLVRQLCDRRAGIGADGVLRIATASALVDHGVLEALPHGVAPTDWFMDYRNADGSVAEMCGNGVRVFAHALVATGHATQGPIRVGTRAGVRRAEIDRFDGDEAVVSVEMGAPRVRGVSSVRVGDRVVAGLAVDMGNPHLACVVPDLDEAGLAAYPLEHPPVFDTDFFPDGVNVEIATPVTAGRMSMRVHERGVGETMSCGTGIVAAAVAALADRGATSGDVAVSVRGGEATVRVGEESTTLTGPSALVAQGTYRAS